ncbi:MAG TPA: MBL fold metallo-hydrolase [Bacteroidales bacterium]|nr:MBL fold metallo-hydrolase [Bacteroidales bacterium]
MKYLLSLVFVSLFVTSKTDKTTTTMTSEDLAKNIHWIQQAGFKIEAGSQKIYIDPVGINANDNASIVLITHAHGDHFSPADIAKIANENTTIYMPASCNYDGKYKAKTIVKIGNKYIINDSLTIEVVPAYNVVKTKFHQHNDNFVGYIITYNGIKIYHTGDTERIPEMKNITANIILVPLGQTYTMNNVEEAANAVKDVKAEIAIPMHFGLYEGKTSDTIAFKQYLEGAAKVIILEKGK